MSFTQRGISSQMWLLRNKSSGRYYLKKVKVNVSHRTFQSRLVNDNVWLLKIDK